MTTLGVVTNVEVTTEEADLVTRQELEDRLAELPQVQPAPDLSGLATKAELTSLSVATGEAFSDVETAINGVVSETNDALAGVGQRITATNTRVDDIAQRTAALEQRPQIQIGAPSELDFDTYFAPGAPGNPNGTDPGDLGRFAALDAWAEARSGQAAAGGNRPRQSIRFQARAYTFSQLGLWAGLHLKGTKTAREYLTGTTFNCQRGSASKPDWAFRWVTNGGYGYPAQGAPRELAVEDIMFNLGVGRHFIEPVTAYATARVLWMSHFSGVGWIMPQSVMQGYTDGVAFSDYHVQGLIDTWFRLAGSETVLRSGKIHSYADSASSNPGNTAGVPMYDLSLSAGSSLRDVMISCRGKAIPLRVSGGGGLLVDGVQLDAPDSEQISGAAIQFRGGAGHRIVNTHIKSAMTNPANAGGGTAANRGWIDIQNTDEVLVEATCFSRAGNNPPATSVPVVYAGPGATNVKIGLNTLKGFGGKAVARQYAAGAITANLDPSIVTSTSVGARLRRLTGRR